MLLKIWRAAPDYKFNEGGFVFLELAVGLPLIIMLLLSLNGLFLNAWTNCKYVFADFVLQQEMESAMNRIVADAKIAYAVEPPEKFNRLRFYQHSLPVFNNLQDRNNEGKPWYKLKSGKIYHNGESSPITGESFLAVSYVTKFEYKQISSHPKLLYIKLEARNLRSNHKITLTTEVFMRGVK